MPIYNRAVRINGVAYFDGAMIDNIPIYPLLRQKLDYIICIYFDDVCYKFENTCFDQKVIRITFPCENRLKQSVVLSREGIQAMLDGGYECGMRLLSPVFSQGHEALSHIYRAVEEENAKQKERRLRLTGDVLVTNLNKITQRLTKRKIL